MKEHKHTESNHHHSDSPRGVFDNPKMLAKKFDAPERDEWQKPEKVIEAFNLSKDATVIEIGSSTGYFAVRIATQIPEGKMIGYEPSQKMANYLQVRAEELGLTNIDARTTEPDGSISQEEVADLIFSVDVYHHLQDRVAYFSNIASNLKSDGVLVIIDRTDEEVEGQPSGHRVPVNTVKEEMEEAGYELLEELDFLLPVQYYLAFKRTA